MLFKIILTYILLLIKLLISFINKLRLTKNYSSYLTVNACSSRQPLAENMWKAEIELNYPAMILYHPTFKPRSLLQLAPNYFHQFYEILYWPFP